VFPKIRQLEAADGDKAAGVAELKTVFAKLESEHDNAGAALERFKELTDGYTPPDWACNTFRAMYDALAKLERNMHQHVHKENNVLFPRALAIDAGTTPDAVRNESNATKDEPAEPSSPACYLHEFQDR